MYRCVSAEQTQFEREFISIGQIDPNSLLMTRRSREELAKLRLPQYKGPVERRVQEEATDSDHVHDNEEQEEEEAAELEEEPEEQEEEEPIEDVRWDHIPRKVHPHIEYQRNATGEHAGPRLKAGLSSFQIYPNFCTGFDQNITGR